MTRSRPRPTVRGALCAVALAVLLPAGTAAAPAAAVPAAPLPVDAPTLPFLAFRCEDQPSREAAQACAQVWTSEAPRLAAALGLRPLDAATAAPPDTVQVLLMGTDAFGRLFAGRLPDWGVGVALPGGRLAAIDQQRLPAVGRGVREVFLHEMTHVLLMRAAGTAPLPAWLHEGLAQRLAGEWRFSDTVTLAMEGRVPNLADLRYDFPGGAQRAARAYLTSELAVGRLLDQYGAGVVPELLAATRREGDFRDAFAAVTGQPVEVFENRFASAMRLRFGWLVMLTRWPSLFVLLALVLAGAAIARIIRTRRAMAGMSDDESGPVANSGPFGVAGCTAAEDTDFPPPGPTPEGPPEPK